MNTFLLLIAASSAGVAVILVRADSSPTALRVLRSARQIGGLFQAGKRDVGTLERRIVRGVLDNASIGVNGTVYLAVTQVVGLHPDDFAEIAPIMRKVTANVTAAILDQARSKGWEASHHLLLSINVDKNARPGTVVVRACHEDATYAPTSRVDEPAGVLLPLAGSNRAPVGLPPGCWLVAGRSQRCDIVIDDDAASREHVRMRVSDGHLDVEDLGSTNGTWVDGQRVSRARVAHGSTVRFGDTVMTFERSPSEPTSG